MKSIIVVGQASTVHALWQITLALQIFVRAPLIQHAAHALLQAIVSGAWMVAEAVWMPAHSAMNFRTVGAVG